MSLYSISQYHSEVENIIHYGGTRKETAIRNAFYNLLNEYAKAKGLMIITEVTIKATNGKNVTPDGTLKDTLRQDWGYWESKDEADVIDDEIKKKFDKGYPKDNILFEDSQTAVLIQNGIEKMRVQMKDAEALDRIITAFVKFERPEVVNFRKAIEHFKEDIPKVTDVIRRLIVEQEADNAKYKTAAKKFLKLCHDSINPEVTLEDVREMIIQHILTQDIFNTIFDEIHFHRENNIAGELERVIDTFFTGGIRKTALASIKHYYDVINATAAGIADHHEKQKFLKVVYETFYKSYNPKAADRLGVVYTPNEVVRFMVESTDYLLHKHFNKLLQDKGVEILDPATGTGTFICDIIDYIRKDKLEYKYSQEMHANEVAILPYYISNLNIEYTYKQKMGAYKEFDALCFVDTLDNMGFKFAGKQLEIFTPFTEENSLRIRKQNGRKISVLIGNPPYNANQANENDNNKNREYPEIDKRIKDTYIKYSTAQKTKVYDMYARFYRWAFDRLDSNGIIAFVTNRSFIDSRTFDGFRKCVQDEFDYAYIVDTRSDVRANPKISGTGHNIFGIQTGVAIMFLVHKVKKENKVCNIRYISMDDLWRKEQKLQWFTENSLKEIPFEHIVPDKNNNWINLADTDFEKNLPLITQNSTKSIFSKYGMGVVTARDEWVYDLNELDLTNRISYLIDTYNALLINKDNSFPTSIKWSDTLKKNFLSGKTITFDKRKIKKALYKPYNHRLFYAEKILNDRLTANHTNFFGENLMNDNLCLGIIGKDTVIPFSALAFNSINDLNSLSNAAGGNKTFPLYLYDNEGNKVYNITDWGLAQFCKRYKTKPKKETAAKTTITTSKSNEHKAGDNRLDPSDEFAQPHLKSNEDQMLHEPEAAYGLYISKEDIFHYTYAVLHNPAYRTKYALNLKREFPRIPFYEDFFKWAAWGKALMALHIEYEAAEPYKLNETTVSLVEKPKVKLKAIKETGVIAIDENTTLSGVPQEAWEYKLGNRSAIEWVLDQYKESKPKDPTIAEHFNTYRFADYKEQVIDLIKRVCTVSVETMRIVKEMEE